MTNKLNKNISVLRINKLRGRMLSLPRINDKKREILLLYGHHASIERMEGISRNLNEYGSVTLPDLPGFGGMDSFYEIGLDASIDNYADYLAAFIKVRFKRKKITIVAMSFSFPVVTRMLQKYPEITRKIDMLVSTVGFVHHEDFRLPYWQQLGLKIIGTIFERKVPSVIFRYTFLTRPIIKLTYKAVQAKHSKMKDADGFAELNKRINAEIKLWQLNDVRTRMRTMADMFRYDLLNKKVDLSVYHVSVTDDRYFNNEVVKQHMSIVYKSLIDIPTTIPGHMPSIVATAEEADPFVPTKLKRLLSRKA
jgi:pimeloyl-ACP methyl ester carboxylesterase